MGITDEGCIQIALAREILESMKQYSDRFSMTTVQMCHNVLCGLPETAGMSKSKVHTTKGLEMLTAEVRSEIQKKWEAVVTPVTGCATGVLIYQLCYTK